MYTVQTNTFMHKLLMMLKVKLLVQASSQDKDIASDSTSKVDLSTKVGEVIAKSFR